MAHVMCCYPLSTVQVVCASPSNKRLCYKPRVPAGSGLLKILLSCLFSNIANAYNIIIIISYNNILYVDTKVDVLF